MIFFQRSILCAALFIFSAVAFAQETPNQPQPRQRRASNQQRPPREAPAEESSTPHFKHFQYDIGLSTGSTHGTSFIELGLGLDIYPVEWFSWRNAPFLRFQSRSDTNYGLDTSLRGHYNLGVESVGLSVHAGPGYRFQNLHPNVPFGEGGVGLRLGGIHIGGNIKVLVYPWVQSGSSAEVVYTITASGGGGF